MTQFDRRTEDALEDLRQAWGPPSGIEDRMLADFRARVEGPPDGGGSAQGGPEGAPPTGGGGLELVFAAKVVAAVAGLTAAGLGVVWLVSASVRGLVERPKPREAPALAAQVDTHEAPAADTPDPSSSPTRSDPPLVAPPPKPQSEPDPRRPSIALDPDSATDSPASAPSPAGPELAAELALLRAAREAPPREGLELLARHSERFPAGALVHEREALRAALLCELGRHEQAEAAIESFLAAEPSELLRRQVRLACSKKIEHPTTTPSTSAHGGGDEP
jgi:hypothetical protein